MALTAAVDLGRTGCRVVVYAASEAVGRASGPGAVGLATPGGVDSAFAAVTATVADAEPGTITAICVGAAGGEIGNEARRELAERLGDHYVGSAAVCSDAVAAHAGALAGAPGTVVSVGTGAVAVGISPTGDYRRVDGWGQWLGDSGSGAWIGREALTLVLRSVDGRARPTRLVEAARARYGEPALLPRTLPLDGDLPRSTAAFAPDVIACAADDAAARSIVERAAAALAETTAAAARTAGVPTVALVGGLADALRERWCAALPAELAPVAAKGTALDGAALLIRRGDLPHERLVTRLG